MDYNGLYTRLLLMRLSNGEYIPLPSVQASYGPFTSMDEAKADLINTFKEISNVPRGYTFCVIENDKPQEYWLTKAGDWSSKEKKNMSSSSGAVSDLLIEARDGYLKVSYDGGDTWTPLVSLEALRGPAGSDGKDGTADLSKVQIKMTSRTVTPSDPDADSYTAYTIKYTTNGGINWIDVGEIRSGSGGGSGDVDITIETWTDGNQYWKMNGVWMEDDQGHMVRANGKDGADGADGAGFYTQFKSIIFKRSNNTRIVNGVELLQESEYPQGGTYNDPVPPTGNWFDGVPAGTAKLWMSTRWFSTNEAITEANEWSVPSPATDTADMDFEYSNAPLEETPNGPGPNKNINMYDASTNPNGWYDADETVLYDGNTLLENANWMAMRICKNGVWGSWKILKIRGESGENPIVPTVEFTSVVFRRSNNTRVVNGVTKLAANEYPQGGSYDSPVPTNTSGGVLLWSDGLPVGNEEILWMSTRIFRSDGNHGDWTEPIVAADGSNGWDFEWHDSETPTTPYPTRQSPDDADPQKTNPNDGWYDEASQNSDPIWMAIRPYEGNQYTASNWTVMRVKGERGTDGTSFVPKGQLFGIFDTTAQAKNEYDAKASTLGNMKYAIVGVGLTSLYEYSSSYPNGRQILNLEIGDAYTNTGGAGKFEHSAGDLKDHIFIWDGDNFVDFGKIKGEKGDAVYFHIKYSNDGGIHFTTTAGVEDGETPGDYIGLRVDSVSADSMNPSDYTWSLFRGEDGFGYEYIFKLTADEHAPLVPTLSECINYVVGEGTQDERTVTFQDDDYVPGFLGWTDDPGSPTKALPYCWVAYRRKVDGMWQPYRGGSADSRYAARFSAYTSNGRGIDHIEEMYAVGASGTEAPALNEFTTTIPAFSLPEYKYLWNYEVIYYDDNTTQTTDPECIAVSERGVGVASIQEFYYACSFGDNEATDLQTHLPQWGGPNRSSAWKTKPMNIGKDNPYLWNFELITFTDGTQRWTDPVIIAYYVYTDIEYLMTIFKKVEGDSDTAYLGGIIGAVEKDANNNDVVRAMLNATTEGYNSKYGKLFIASGMNGTQDAANATFKVYENGRVEMRDAVIQGFLQQYYKNQNNVVKDPTVTTAQGIDTSKVSNYVMLGWEGLLPSEIKSNVIKLSTTITYSTFDLPAGRIVFTNQLYLKDDRTLFFNKNHKKTQLQGNFLFPSGALLRNSEINLYGGWVEVSKFTAITNDLNEVVPSNSSYEQVYMVHAWGGSVAIPLGSCTGPDVNSADAIVGTNSVIVKELSAYRFVSNDETVARINPENRYISVNGTSSDSPLYLVMPTFDDSALEHAQYPRVIEYNIEIGTGREIIFKINHIANVFNDADVDNLEDLYVKYSAGVSKLTCPARVNGEYNRLLRLTYIPFSNVGRVEEWSAEMVHRITEVPATT